MLITEANLKKLINRALLMEDPQSLGDIIADFSEDFADAKADNAEADALLSIKKNNTLLQIIFDLLSDNQYDFKNFYKKSKLVPANDSNKWFNVQNDKKDSDNKKIAGYLKKFFEAIRKDDVTAESYEKSLKTLTDNIKSYVPKWIPLQVLFYFLDQDDIETVISNFANDDNNFKKMSNKPFLMIPDETKTKVIVDRIVEIINSTILDDDEKQIILSKMVKNSSFKRSVEEGNWGDVTDVMDNAWNFLMKNNSGSTSKIFGGDNKMSSGLSNWFDETGKDFAKAAKFSNTDSPFGKIGNIGDTLSQAMSAIENQSPEGKNFLKNMLSDKSNPVGSFFDKLFSFESDGRPVSGTDLSKAMQEIIKELEDVGVDIAAIQKNK